MTINKWLILLAVSFYTMAGCQTISNSPIPTTLTVAPTTISQSTNTTQPTNTFLPTDIPRPTSTPIPPTATIAPADMLTKYLENVRVTGYDNFDSSLGWSNTNEISNGVLKLIGLGGTYWHGVANNASFQEDKGIVISFEFTPGSFFEMFFENGQWNTEPYKRFGVSVSHGSAQTEFFKGSKGIDPYQLPGNLALNAGIWYSMFIATGKSGDLLTLIWDPAKPNVYLRYRETIESLKGVNWTFRTQVNEGTITFDDFEEIEFDGIK